MERTANRSVEEPMSAASVEKDLSRSALKGNLIGIAAIIGLLGIISNSISGFREHFMNQLKGLEPEPIADTVRHLLEIDQICHSNRISDAKETVIQVRVNGQGYSIPACKTDFPEQNETRNDILSFRDAVHSDDICINGKIDDNFGIYAHNTKWFIPRCDQSIDLATN